MKVSKEQKAETRRRLLRAAVELISEKGFADTTMREISSRAGYSPGTIYHYFANKEGIFYAYFDEKQNELKKELEELPDFDEFDLKEKLQTLLETQLEVYAGDREFVAITYKALMDSPMRSFSELGQVKDKFTDIVKTFFLTEAENRDFVPRPIEEFLVHLFWDYKNLVVLYWLNDRSANYTNSSQLIDMSLDIYLEIIRNGLVSKLAGVFVFLVKGHIYGNIDKLYDLMAKLAEGHLNSDKSPDSVS